MNNSKQEARLPLSQRNNMRSYELPVSWKDSIHQGEKWAKKVLSLPESHPFRLQHAKLSEQPFWIHFKALHWLLWFPDHLFTCWDLIPNPETPPGIKLKLDKHRLPLWDDAILAGGGVEFPPVCRHHVDVTARVVPDDPSMDRRAANTGFLQERATKHHLVRWSSQCASFREQNTYIRVYSGADDSGDARVLF